MRSHRKIFIISMGSIVAAVFLGMALAFATMNAKDWYNYAIDISALVASFIALVISIITYFSIDKVNDITSMEGNVLENENYTVATAALVHEFDGCADKEEFTDKLLRVVSHPSTERNSGRKAFRSEKQKRKYLNSCDKTSTIIEFADLLQNFIDHLIWFAYINQNDVEEREEAILKSMNANLTSYEQLSNGVQYQLEENYKLIRHVLLYQKARRDNEYDYSMENIRGKMLRNPISQIVYYDYFGLSRRRQAAEILSKPLSDEEKAHEEFTAERMRAVQKHSYTDAEREEAELYLRLAMECFDKARELSTGDILWKGYISYNRARVHIQRVLLDKSADRETHIVNVKQELREMVSSRKDVAILYQGDSYLMQQFEAELKRGEALEKNFLSWAESLDR